MGRLPPTDSNGPRQREKGQVVNPDLIPRLAGHPLYHTVQQLWSRSLIFHVKVIQQHLLGTYHVLSLPSGSSQACPGRRQELGLGAGGAQGQNWVGRAGGGACGLEAAGRTGCSPAGSSKFDCGPVCTRHFLAASPRESCTAPGREGVGESVREGGILVQQREHLTSSEPWAQLLSLP